MNQKIGNTKKFMIALNLFNEHLNKKELNFHIMQMKLGEKLNGIKKEICQVYQKIKFLYYIEGEKME